MEEPKILKPREVIMEELKKILKDSKIPKQNVSQCIHIAIQNAFKRCNYRHISMRIFIERQVDPVFRRS